MNDDYLPNKNEDSHQQFSNSSSKDRGSGMLDSSDTLSASEIQDFVQPYNSMMMANDGRFSYSSHSMNPYDSRHWWIPMDHCYARPWNWRPESIFLKPTKTLFVPKTTSRKRKSVNPLALLQDHDDVIDVVSETEEATSIYDKERALQLMDECERHAALARIEDSGEDWEEGITKTNWTPTQHRLFTNMVSILNSARLSRLSYTHSHNEPVARRACIDKSVQKFRKLMSTILWDSKYTQWLHQLLIDHLTLPYLAAYLDLLQTLNAKLPRFVDKKLLGASATTRPSILNYENLFPLLKRPWDPVATSFTAEKPKKLPGNPVIVIIPSISVSSKRMLKWINLLSHMATVVTIPPNYGGVAASKITITNYVDQMFVMTRNKIQDVRMDYPGKNICLVGFGFGATLALHVAQVEQVLCVVCVGFSLYTAEGRRGDSDDSLLELQWPVLFITGQRSNTSVQEDMEDLRERMRVETGLIIVGDADDNLRISKKKKRAEGITQAIVDRCISDEIGEFISGLILSPFPPQIRQSPTDLTTDGPMPKKMKTERKRYNSNTSSIESEPPSPTPRISRPGQINSPPNIGRPPGSKTKPKWTQQGIPVIQSSPSNSSPITITPDTSSNDSSTNLDRNSTSDMMPMPIKKIKTIVPFNAANQIVTSSTAHSTVMNAGPMQNESQGPIQKSSCGIKVLENVKLGTATSTQKYFANTSKVLDMSKVSVINSKTGTGNSIMLLPDGKIKNITQSQVSRGRYITSKRQLIGNKPPKPIIQKRSYISQIPVPPALPPPANLTTEEIMDLPIIFADDNQIIDASLHQSEQQIPSQVINPPPPPPPKVMNKFMVVNKQPAPTTSYIISPSKPIIKPPPKYTKIILSSKKPEEKNLLPHIPNLSSEISIKKISKIDDTDLEGQIASTTVFRTLRCDLNDDASNNTPKDS